MRSRPPSTNSTPRSAGVVDPASWPSSTACSASYVGRPSPLTDARGSPKHYGSASCSSADLNHRLAPRSTTSSARRCSPSDGQAARHRRDRRQAARRRHRDHWPPTRPRCVCMGEEDTAGAPTWRMRLTRRRGGRAARRQPHPQGRHEQAMRGTGSRTSTTHPRSARWPDRPPVRRWSRDLHRVIGVEARAQVLRPRRPAAGRGVCPRASAARSNAIGIFRLSDRRHALFQPPGPAATTSRPDSTRRPSPAGCRACCTAMHLRPAGPGVRPVRNHSVWAPAWTTLASAPSTPGLAETGRAAYEPVTDAGRRRWTLRASSAVPRHHPRDRARTPSRGAARRAELGPGRRRPNLSGRRTRTSRP